MVKNLSFVIDAHGRFYAGMTLKEAQNNGTDKSFWHRDFHNLDKNKDGVLSVSEVMNERKRSSNIDKFFTGLFGLWGLADIMTGSGSKTWRLLNILLDAYIVGSSAMSAYKTDKGTQRINKELQRMSENNLNVNV